MVDDGIRAEVKVFATLVHDENSIVPVVGSRRRFRSRFLGLIKLRTNITEAVEGIFRGEIWRRIFVTIVLMATVAVSDILILCRVLIDVPCLEIIYALCLELWVRILRLLIRSSSFSEISSALLSPTVVVPLEYAHQSLKCFLIATTIRTIRFWWCKVYLVAEGLCYRLPCKVCRVTSFLRIECRNTLYRFDLPIHLRALWKNRGAWRCCFRFKTLCISTGHQSLRSILNSYAGMQLY